jgi:hypothetical protein
MTAVYESIRLLGTKTVPDAVRLVDADQDSGAEGGPVLLVIPPQLSEANAILAVNESIDQAGIETNDGMDGGYFLELSARLARYGIAIKPGLEVLKTKPWDATHIKNDESMKFETSRG